MYFNNKGGGQSGNADNTSASHDNISNNMVTLLTSESSLQPPPSNAAKVANLGTKVSPFALELCSKKGIRVEPVVDFYKR